MVTKIFIALLLTIFLLVFIPVYGLRESSRQEKAQAKIISQSAEMGAETYISLCASCHGSQGEGRVGPALRDTKLERETLSKVISFGRLDKRIPMPAMGQEMGGPLKKHQIEDVINFIKNWDQSLVTRAQAKHPPAAPPVVKTSSAPAETKSVPSIAEQVSTPVPKLPSPETSISASEEAAQKSPALGSPEPVPSTITPTPAPKEPDIAGGKELYLKFGCAMCHGPEGKGGIGPSIVGKSKVEISQMVRSSRSPAMPSFSAEKLPDGELDKIMDFIGSLGK